jgi:hypothetical protein
VDPNRASVSQERIENSTQSPESVSRLFRTTLPTRTPLGQGYVSATLPQRHDLELYQTPLAMSTSIRRFAV